MPKNLDAESIWCHWDHTDLAVHALSHKQLSEEYGIVKDVVVSALSS